MRILWSGPYYSDYALKMKTTPAPSELRWSVGLMSAVNKIAEVEVVNHVPEQRWPKGRVIWQSGDAKWFRDDLPVSRIGYLNVVGLKDACLCQAYARNVRRMLKQGRFNVFMCYNSLHPYHVAAMREAKKLGVKVVPIILDGNDPRGDNWQKLTRDNRYADGVVFLSYWAYENYPGMVDGGRGRPPVLQLDGGENEWRGGVCCSSHDVQSSFTVVHTGALDKWRGLRVMQKLLKVFDRRDVRFVFCGKCDRVKRLAELGNDSRIEVKGFVSEEEMNEICRCADAFISVRDPEVGDNVLNYPSKIPYCLSWGKPVVSTWVESFSPDYRDVLVVPMENDAVGIAKKLNEIVSWTDEQRSKHFELQRRWFESRKTWAIQAHRLVEFLEQMRQRQ